MSSVVISGNTSGTVTLDAPAVAGTTVLTLPATSGTVLTGPGGVAQVTSGGTGASTLTANNVLLGNGTSAVQFVAPGSSGNVLTSNGTTWASTAAASGQLQTQLFTAPGTWTKPASATLVRVTVMGGGGGSAGSNAPGGVAGGRGGSGGMAYVTNVPVSAPVTITVGTAGAGGATAQAAGSPGNTSSFGPVISCTGGAGGTYPGAAGADGAATISAGTTLKSGSIFAISSSTSSGVGLSIGSVMGTAFNLSGTPASTYSSTSPGIAGAPGASSYIGGTGGAVVVEFVG